MRLTIIKKYGLLLFLGASLVACDKNLNIKPKQGVDAAVAIETAEDLEAARIGCYGMLAKGSLYGTNLNLVPELLGSDSYLTWRGSFQSYRQIARRNMLTDNADVQRTWIDAYQAIELANVILDKYSIATTTDEQNRVKGTALMVRGMMHFELVRLYAKQYDAATAATNDGVPLSLIAVYDEEGAAVLPHREKVNVVYNQVITDLTEAASLLPERDSYYFTKYTAMAMLSRVYLQMGDYAKARDAANEVIDSGNYGLNPVVTIAFNNRNSSESIFEIQQNDQNNAGTANDGLTTFYASKAGSVGRGDAQVNSAFADSYEDNDTRGEMSLIYHAEEGSARSTSVLCTGKFTSFGQNIPVIRLAEMYLTRAECNLRLGTTIGDTPANDLNQIRKRAGVTDIASPTVDNVLHERQLEFAYEGLRIHDIRRVKASTGGYSWDDPELVLPIPKREIDATKGSLTQNEGYY
ncbi:RagB/SusD family nutrient uptake outer membrane protein [Solitalea sp. MAHUQ-68]|uniref:RagB/SusD family nutrient uptake outer membrane protein n=1 Tax=Solitalea agri TaxID=2953739 RepID=A0A9X2EZK1_9SPHI|nr:RagB/SusD family nutrient uptake outer membrane protein [Solitalea agri]MCO4291289.1 RagB/SusD family nutrient uptake outer membrane protein [Solitalea agri]